MNAAQRSYVAAWLLLTFVTSLACAASAGRGGLSVARKGDTLTIECQAPATVGALSLCIHSDRNASVPRFSDVSPLQPSAWPDGRQSGRELWWPVIDFAVDDTMEAVVELADMTGSGIAFTFSTGVRTDRW